MGGDRLMSCTFPGVPHLQGREGAGSTGRAPPRAGLTRVSAPSHAGISPPLKGEGYSSCGYLFEKSARVSGGSAGDGAIA